MFGAGWANMNGCKKKKTCNPKKKIEERGGENFNQSSFRECIRDLFFYSLSRLRAFRNLVLVVADIYKAPIPSAASQIEWICKIVRRKHWEEGNEMRRKNERNNPHRQKARFTAAAAQFIFSCIQTSFFQSSSSSSCLVLWAHFVNSVRQN